MMISVIMPFRNSARHLPRFLETLAGQRYPCREFLLVDSNSGDGSADMVRVFGRMHPDLSITLLQETKPGALAARNRGAEKARLLLEAGFSGINVACMPLNWLTKNDVQTGFAKRLACQLLQPLSSFCSFITFGNLSISPSLVAIARKG